MYRGGHIGITLAFVGLLGIVLPTSIWIPIGIGVLIAERIPDKDQVLPIKHRGYSHTIIGAIITATIITIAAVFTSQQTIGLPPGEILLGSGGTVHAMRITLILIWICVLCGFLVHFLGDMITKGTGDYGVQPLAPYSYWESSIQLCKAKSPRWNMIFLIGGIVIFATGLLIHILLHGGSEITTITPFF